MKFGATLLSALLLILLATSAFAQELEGPFNCQVSLTINKNRTVVGEFVTDSSDVKKLTYDKFTVFVNAGLIVIYHSASDAGTIAYTKSGFASFFSKHESLDIQCR